MDGVGGPRDSHQLGNSQSHLPMKGTTVARKDPEPGGVGGVSRFADGLHVFLNTFVSTNSTMQHSLIKCWCSNSVEISWKSCQKL